MVRLSAPIFGIGANRTLASLDSYTRSPAPLPRLDGMLAMTGPSVTADPGCLPVRGDLAHIKLAGLCFVPHYAVPMPHTVAHLIWLRSAPNLSSNEIAEVPVGSTFNVLDISGNWAWGQVGEDGAVGYLPMTALIAA